MSRNSVGSSDLKAAVFRASRVYKEHSFDKALPIIKSLLEGFGGTPERVIKSRKPGSWNDFEQDFNSSPLKRAVFGSPSNCSNRFV